MAKYEQIKFNRFNRFFVTVLAMALSICFTGFAVACSRPMPDHKAPAPEIQAKQAFIRADAVVDGMIIRPSGYNMKERSPIPAILKVSKTYKGPQVTYFALRIPGGGCEIGFRKTEKVRLLLKRDGDSWAAPEFLNLPEPRIDFRGDALIDYSLLFARAIDRLVGRPRSRDTAIVPYGV